MHDVLADLEAEHTDLEGLVAGLTDNELDAMTPAEPWTIRDQIGHLAFFDEMAAVSASDPEAFVAELNSMADLGERYMDQHLDRARAMTPSELLHWWRTARAGLLEAFSRCEPDERLVWYGPPMRAESAATARLMETWAHGLDIADTLGVVRPPTDRLFRIADLGVRTFRFSYENRGLTAPDSRVRVALRGVTGNMRVWNDAESDSITGPVEDFCMVVAQRRNVTDTHLFCEGDLAHQWMKLAQVFAGPPGPGRSPTGN
ncbi:MAG: TIGR03084 family metal-binding protein [Acidimicrobiia bacterium]|nr:TIGR03084 family metal-binding protein [Acidimicrobiia bacterium]MDH4308416.1 TIGR03084 family metal-binding protein [Acidimicrobiia bacterium]MDH5520712.1 TIGR03084 family metal-binding protein [Acidimicrobiia bacterium]